MPRQLTERSQPVASAIYNQFAPIKCSTSGLGGINFQPIYEPKIERLCWYWRLCCQARHGNNLRNNQLLLAHNQNPIAFFMYSGKNEFVIYFTDSLLFSARRRRFIISRVCRVTLFSIEKSELSPLGSKLVSPKKNNIKSPTMRNKFPAGMADAKIIGLLCNLSKETLPLDNSRESEITALGRGNAEINYCFTTSAALADNEFFRKH